MNRTARTGAGLSPHRLEALADGIFAIAMTLLVLELRVPEATGPEDLATRLADLWPRFATFFISFVVLGVYWFAHHQTFYFIVRVNRTLVWLSILFFLGAALVPFVASLLGSYPQDPVALSLYGAVLGLLAAVGYVIWWYITGDRGLTEEKLDPDLVAKVCRWIAIGPLIMPVAIVLAFVQPVASLLIYLALPPLFVLFNPVDSYLERLRQGERSVGR
jgi:uncharacterized membrane protein